jgi:preprotein translocase SecE subunit
MMSTKKKGPEADSSNEMNAKDSSGGSGSKSDGPATKKEKNPAPKAKTAAKAPSDRKDTPKKKKDEDSGVAEGIKDTRQFLKEVVIEFNKITWPERGQVIRETYSVLFLVTMITLMVLCFDWFLGNAIFGPLEHWARLHGGGIGKG